MDIYRIVLALLILAYAGYSDIRKRSASNIVWLVMIGLGIAFAGYGAVTQGISFLIPPISSVVITGGMSYAFFRSGLFGAADAKALICIALLFPTQPGFTIFSHTFPLFDAAVSAVFPFAFMVLLNAAVLALTVPISLFFRNLRVSGLKGFMGNASMRFVGYRVNIDEIRSDRFTRLAHKYDEIDGRVTRRYSWREIPLDCTSIQRLKTYRAEGKIGAEVWVTPELPFIPFITLGFLACCLLGI